MVEPWVEEALAARRRLRDEATQRQIERPCPDRCGHDHLSASQLVSWGLWAGLRDGWWGGKRPPQRGNLPPPEVLARPPREDEVPKTAWELYRRAGEHGWYGSITYSRGPITHSLTGKYLRMADVITVRLARHVDTRDRHGDMQRLVAAWIDGKFKDATAWGAGSSAVVLGSAAMKQHIERTRSA